MSEFPDNQFVNRLSGVKLIFLSLLFAMVLVVVLIVARLISSPFLFVAAIMLAMLVAVSFAYGIAGQRAEKRKHKRGVESVDAYSMIDRMVDDLDEDELAYLEKSLDARKKVDSAESAERLAKPHVQKPKR